MMCAGRQRRPDMTGACGSERPLELGGGMTRKYENFDFHLLITLVNRSLKMVLNGK